MSYTYQYQPVGEYFTNQICYLNFSCFAEETMKIDKPYEPFSGKKKDLAQNFQLPQNNIGR